MEDSEHTGAEEEEVVAAYRWTHDLAQRLDVGRADDLTQDALMAALRTGPRGAGLRHWIAAVLRTRSRDFRRAEARRSLHERQAARLEAADSGGAIDGEILAQLDAALATLSPSSAEVLRLRFEEGLEGEPLAARLKCSPSASRQRVSRAIRELRASMGHRDTQRTIGILPFIRFLAGRTASPTHTINSMHALLASAALLALTVPSLWAPQDAKSDLSAANPCPPSAAVGHGAGSASCSDCHLGTPPKPVPKKKRHGEGRSCLECHKSADSPLVAPYLSTSPDSSFEDLLAMIAR